MLRVSDDHTIFRVPLAYEGAGKDLDLSGAGKELAGAGNLGCFYFQLDLAPVGSERLGSGFVCVGWIALSRLCWTSVVVPVRNGVGGALDSSVLE